MCGEYNHIMQSLFDKCLLAILKDTNNERKTNNLETVNKFNVFNLYNWDNISVNLYRNHVDIEDNPIENIILRNNCTYFEGTTIIKPFDLLTQKPDIILLFITTYDFGTQIEWKFHYKQIHTKLSLIYNLKADGHADTMYIDMDINHSFIASFNSYEYIVVDLYNYERCKRLYDILMALHVPANLKNIIQERKQYRNWNGMKQLVSQLINVEKEKIKIIISANNQEGQKEPDILERIHIVLYDEKKC
tara:strand:- start:68 stop:808 length:741 start_codon:yes stop_codon:yes gene_type:complete